jgi:hypothetical protein
LNVTAVPSGFLGYLTIWPAGQTMPVVSTLNALDGQVTANAAIVPAGVDGGISMYAMNTTHVVIDINGYFDVPQANSLAFYPVTPCRVADTRGPAGLFSGPALPGGVARSFPIPQSACGIPSAAKAYAFNVTVVPHGFLGFLSAWPAGTPQPGVSTTNAHDGATVANMAVVPAGTDGAVSFIGSHATDLVLDVAGYFAPPGQPGALNFYTAPPCRVVDTRFAGGALGSPSIGAGQSRGFPLLQGGCGLPAAAQAYSLNVTAVPPGFLGYLTVWPTGLLMPGSSTLNALDGHVTANAAIVPAGTGGSIHVYGMNPTNVIIDVNGYFAQ